MFLRILLLSIILINSCFAFNNEQDILISSPKEVDAGDNFLLIVSIPANLLSGVTKIQLDLPNGFEAKVRKTGNAEFKFIDQKASFQWLKFPESEIVEVSIDITTPTSYEGYYVIKAKALYFKNSEPVKISIQPQILTLVKNSTQGNDMLLINDKTTVTFESFKSEGVACIRQVPYLKDGEIFVNLLISKGNFNKYGKIQEKIPTGYRVVNIKSHNAIFVFNDKQRTLKYMWMNMPDKDKFIVTYKLIPTKDIDDSNPFLIFGNFFYADKNSTKSVEIAERGIDLEQTK